MGKSFKELDLSNAFLFAAALSDADVAYVADVNDVNLNRLHDSVTRVKQLKELEEKFMTGQELLDISYRKGVTASVIELLSELGTVSETLEEAIRAERNLDTLKSWVKLAARVSSVEEFAEKMNG